MWWNLPVAKVLFRNLFHNSLKKKKKAYSTWWNQSHSSAFTFDLNGIAWVFKLWPSHMLTSRAYSATWAGIQSLLRQETRDFFSSIINLCYSFQQTKHDSTVQLPKLFQNQKEQVIFSQVFFTTYLTWQMFPSTFGGTAHLYTNQYILTGYFLWAVIPAILVLLWLTPRKCYSKSIERFSQRESEPLRPLHVIHRMLL